MHDAPVPTLDAVRLALDGVKDPRTGQGLFQAGEVKGLVVRGDRAGFMIEVPAPVASLYAPVREAAERVLLDMGFATVQVVLTTEQAPAAPRGSGRASLSPEAVSQTKPKAPVPTARPDHVRAVLAVGSGKGGVGKSTVALNLAIALSQRGLKVGVMDADVYGPSIPLMTGMTEAPAYRDGKMEPHRAWGIFVNSVGFLVKGEDAMIWRGPMASQAITQLLTQTRWGTDESPMDVLIVDLPPGTGDVQLTLMQKTPLDGAVVVSTPQEAALIDARRAMTLFDKVEVPVLGLVENMAYLADPATGARLPIFGEGGVKALSSDLCRPYLGEVPIDMALRQGGDAGQPLTATAPQSETAKAFATMAETISLALGL